VEASDVLAVGLEDNAKIFPAFFNYMLKLAYCSTAYIFFLFSSFFFLDGTTVKFGPPPP